MTLTSTKRIESLDFVKGLVIVIMALDHVRDYFHFSAHFFDPMDPTQTTWPIYLTRWITNFCAPSFSFLAGLSAYLVGKRKSSGELSRFLFKRGLWLVFVEVIVVTFGWTFEIHFYTFFLQTIWSLGISMIALAALIYLPRTMILVFSCIVIFGHNLIDGVHFDGSILWSMFHERNRFMISEGHYFIAAYPFIPWVAVMSLGYWFGGLYEPSFDASKRRRILNGLGLGSFVALAALLIINRYGDPVQWQHFDYASKTWMSVFRVTKYPPSLLFLLTTLGGMFLVLANSENLRGKVAELFRIFGRVPFLFYVVHIYFIHLLAMVATQATGFGWQRMILPKFVTVVDDLKGYGFGLWVVYVIWIVVILAMYPICRWFDLYKQQHKEKWWLSYL